MRYFLLPTYVTFCFLILCGTVPLIAQVGDDYPPDAIPGNCYAKVLMAERRTADKVVDSLIFVYTGNETRRVADWHLVQFQTEAANENSIQHIHTDRCQYDCRTMHIQYEKQEAPEYIDLKVIWDTIGRSDFVEEWYEVYVRGEILADGGFVDWQRILCGDQMTSRFYSEATYALKDLGFAPEEDGQYAFKAALTKFQRSEGLAVGQVTDETLRALGLGGIDSMW